MSIEPLLSAGLVIQVHVVAAICAIVLGPVALLRRSRDIWHKVAGRVWVVAMLVVAVSSFWISEAPMLGPFGPIHVLSVLTLWGLFQGMRAIRRGDIVRHQGEMRGLYFWAMGVAGLFTFLPGRRMNTVFFGENAVLGFVVAALVIGGMLALYARSVRRVSV